jgi:hypothetical protein
MIASASPYLAHEFNEREPDQEHQECESIETIDHGLDSNNGHSSNSYRSPVEP